MSLEQEVKEKFICNGNRMGYQDLIDCYKERFIIDETFKTSFKKTVAKLASVQEENGKKFLVLKAKFTQQKKMPVGLKSSVMEALRIEPSAESESAYTFSLFDVDALWETQASLVPQIKVTESDVNKQPLPQNTEFSSISPDTCVLEPDLVDESCTSQSTADASAESVLATTDDKENMPGCDSKESTPESLPLQQPQKHGRLGNFKGAAKELSSSSENCSFASVLLSGEEKAWLGIASKSDYDAMVKALGKMPDIAHCQDFTCGYNALHWAAKNGNISAISLLASNYKLDVDRKTHGGYTPLHLAAMHGHYNVMEILIQNYGASRNIRDNSGRKAEQYVNNAFGTKFANASTQAAHKTMSATPCKRRLLDIPLKTTKISTNFLNSLYPSKLHPKAADFDHNRLKSDETSIISVNQSDQATDNLAIKPSSSLPNALNLCANKRDRLGSSLRLSKRMSKPQKLKSSGPQLAAKFLSLTMESVNFRTGPKLTDEAAQKHKSIDV